MSLQYPHFLYRVDIPDDSDLDGSGNWSPQVGSDSSLLSVCREKKEGKGTEINGVDGKKHVYSSVISAPASCPDIPFGTIIFVKDSETESKERIRASVKLFDRGQFFCRLWV